MNYCKRKKAVANVVSFTTVAQLPDNWDDDLPAAHFLRKASLLVHEQTGLPDMQVVYAGILIDGQWQGRAAFQVLSLQEKHLNKTTIKPWQQLLWKWFSKSVKPRLLVAGQLFRHDVQSFHWLPALSPFDAFRYFQQVIAVVSREYCAQAVLVKETPEAFVPYFLHHAPEYIMLRNDSSMQLKLPPQWQSFKDYEKSLKHKYAQRLRKVRQPWEALRIVELSAAEVNEQASRIYDLYEQVTEKQPVRLGLLSNQFLPRLKAFYGDRLKIWGIYEDEKMIAFASAWVQDHSFDMFYIGFDYERNAALNLYFNILYFSVEQAILLRKPELILGRTALEAKARVGCRLEYLHTFLFIKNSLVRNLVGRLQQRFAETGGEWENRHPFKPDVQLDHNPS
jgi:hypothetical protein